MLKFLQVGVSTNFPDWFQLCLKEWTPVITQKVDIFLAREGINTQISIRLSDYQIVNRPCQSHGLLYKHFRDSFIHSLIRCHARMVKVGASSHKINFTYIFHQFWILKGNKIAALVQKLRQLCWMGGFCLLVELHPRNVYIFAKYYISKWSALTSGGKRNMTEIWISILTN